MSKDLNDKVVRIVSMLYNVMYIVLLKMDEETEHIKEGKMHFPRQSSN